MRRTVIVMLGLALSGAAAAQMQMPGHDMKDSGDMKMSQPAGALADGEVRKVDRDAKKITLRHGPLPGSGMSMAMTMVYPVSDPVLLEKVKAGDKVKFQAEKVDGALTVTKIEPAR